MKLRLIGGLFVLFVTALLSVSGAGPTGSAHPAGARAPVEGQDAIVSPPVEGLLGGTVTFADGSPVAGLVVDFFEANADGSRGMWLGDETSDQSGVFARSVTAGCYVLTYIAPDGESFVGGGRYFQIGVCVEAGEKLTGLDAQLSSAPVKGLLGGRVTFVDGSPVAGLVIDFFEANADGSRATWLGDETTDPQGSYGRVVDPGCYVLVFLAPAGARFTDGDGVFLEAPICVEDQAAVDAVLVTFEPCTIHGQVVVSPLAGPECDALVAFFDSTGGPNWIDNTGWSTPTDPCNWLGIRCGSGMVTAIVLPFNELAGTLPADLAQFSGLRDLNLTGNQLTGPIPPGIDRLSLAFLNLGQNQLSGPIPTDLAAAFVLDLGGNQLTGPIPPEFGQVRAVFILLQGNQLSGPVPPELGQLSRVQDLVLNDNRLSGTIPAELGQLTNLSRLDLRRNELSGSLPAELGEIPALRFLELNDNQLTGDITAAMTGLRSQGTLESLRLSDGPGRNNCLTVTDGDLASWVSTFDEYWAECG